MLRVRVQTQTTRRRCDWPAVAIIRVQRNNPQKEIKEGVNKLNCNIIMTCTQIIDRWLAGYIIMYTDTHLHGQ